MLEDKVLELLKQLGQQAGELGGRGWEVLVQYHWINALIWTAAFALAEALALAVFFTSFRAEVDAKYASEEAIVTMALSALAAVAFLILLAASVRGIFVPEYFALQELLRKL